VALTLTFGLAASGACLLIVVVTLPLATASLHRRRRKLERRAAWRNRQVEHDLYRRRA